MGLEESVLIRGVSLLEGLTFDTLHTLVYLSNLKTYGYNTVLQS